MQKRARNKLCIRTAEADSDGGDASDSPPDPKQDDESVATALAAVGLASLPATWAEVEKAVRATLRVAHPDKNLLSSEAATAKTAAVLEARKVLKAAVVALSA